MGQAFKVPVCNNNYKSLVLDLREENIGNLQNILSNVTSEQYISYATNGNICVVEFSFLIKGNCSTDTDSSSTGTDTAIWITLNEKLPKPMITSRGQAIPVNSDTFGSANIRVDPDGTTKILINNFNSNSANYFQNSFMYLLAE